MKSISAIALAIGLLAAASANAAVTVGNANSGNCYPFECNDSGSSSGQSFDYQQIYSASAFTGSSTFNAITFFDTIFPGPVLHGNYDITFSTTTAAVGASYPVVPLANTATFFDGALGGAIGSSFTITGSTYTYNPASGNLVMEVVVTNQDNVANGEGNGYFDADTSGSMMSRAYYNGNMVESDGTGLVTEFNTATTTAVPEPSMSALWLAGLAAVGFVLRRKSAGASRMQALGA